MIDLNDLRVFASVARLRSFSAAAREIGMPKSSVSRGIARLEHALSTRLVQRTTREVRLTASGILLQDRCLSILTGIDQAVDEVGSLGDGPRGVLRITSGIGFGLNVLSDLLPPFIERHPHVRVALELTSRNVDLVAEGMDIAIRIGPMNDSEMVSTHLGTICRYTCASPIYLQRRGEPGGIRALAEHDLIEMLGSDGRPRPWIFHRPGQATITVENEPRIAVNDPVTIHRLVVNGAGIGVLSGYLCAPDIAARRLIRLFSEWELPPLDVSLVFPSSRELSPSVRAFVTYMKAVSAVGLSWQDDIMAVSHPVTASDD
ncbi:LysR family transcriptional regulator [Lichenifustis flavocetrariae]|uniref:LysR family transcriptional regulator n=1 Tax=Lichenifustis flavocetrariae TaxID=2949735 RepID=A0AA41Z685_9HYPH|nr:LysR family transcriptional regulator [Lichenifustis flavocetrariae]MCW6510032.1 LysR family transcriptional regulator [Lichenifustis flavocetrariae]